MKVAKSNIFSNPILALAGLIKCKCCDAAIMQISAKGEGYYGCSNARRENCNNKQRISRHQVEAIILNDLKEKFLTAENLRHMGELVRIVELEPTPGKYLIVHAQPIKISSYYVAHTSIQTVALLYEGNKSEF